MKTLIFTLCLSLLPTIALSQDIWEESETQENDTNAKVLRHIAKQRAAEANMTKEEREKMREQQSSGCGSTNIGNVSGGGKNVENVVIIKGDVINANNKCN